jgi:hypothetical protein
MACGREATLIKGKSRPKAVCQPSKTDVQRLSSAAAEGSPLEQRVKLLRTLRGRFLEKLGIVQKLLFR